MSKPKKTNRHYHPALVLVLAMAFYLGVGTFLVEHFYTSKPSTQSRVGFGQNFRGDKYYQSLDLNIAKMASYPSAPMVKTADLGEVHSTHRYIVNFEVKNDGLSEYALMSVPTSKMPEGGYPVILLLHAYYLPSEYKTTLGYLTDMNFYAQHGFVVIKPDFRGQGYSRSQGRPEGSNYSMAYNTDVMSLISAVKQTPYLEAKKINLWGHSMGAHIALRTSVLSPDIKTVILLSGPVSNFSKMYSDYSAPSDIGNTVASSIRSAALIKYGTPKTNPIFWGNVSPINFIQSSKAYYQIHVGSDDVVVPPEFSADLDIKLSSLSKNHGYFVYTEGDHDLYGYRQQIWQRSLSALSTSP
jgi:uncharacterized protein